MPVSRSSSDIELPVLTSHARSSQPPPEQVPSSSPILEANSVAIVDGVVEPELPTPAYFPPSSDIPPIPTSDAGLLEYTRLHGHSEIPLSPRQREDDRTSLHASDLEAGPAEAAEPLPAYRGDNPPRYSQVGRDSGEPMTWPAISFRIGFLFPLFWLFGALTLITPQGSLDRIFMPWFKDFAPSAYSWCDTLQTEAEKEEYLARMRVTEMRWARRCLVAFSLLLGLILAATVALVVTTRNS